MRETGGRARGAYERARERESERARERESESESESERHGRRSTFFPPPFLFFLYFFSLVACRFGGKKGPKMTTTPPPENAPRTRPNILVTGTPGRMLLERWIHWMRGQKALGCPGPKVAVVITVCSLNYGPPSAKQTKNQSTLLK